MKPILIAIAGGTGAGKSTFTFGLLDKHPDKISIVHLDDYHKRQGQVPTLAGFPNWDHPDAIDFEQCKKDLKQLLGGKPVKIMTKNERDNPEYNVISKEIFDADNSTTKTKGKIEVIVEPKHVIFLEGFLALAHREIRDLSSTTVFLDLTHEERMKRRTKFIDGEYENEVLIPMHEKHVEGSKKFAEHVIDVSELTKEELVQKGEEIVKEFL